MNRKQAIDIVKELNSVCPHMEGKPIKLKQVELADPFSYEIEIRMGSYRLIEPQVMAVSAKNNCSVA